MIDLDVQALVAALGMALLHFLWQGLLIAVLLEWALIGMRKSSADARYLARCVGLFAMAGAPVLTFALLLESGGDAALLGVVAVVTEHAVESFISPALPWIVLGWSLGATLLSLRLVGGWLRLVRLRARVERALLPARWQHTFDRLAGEIGVRAIARVADSATVAVPMMIGWLKPIVLVPARVFTGLTEEQIAALLAHELAHVRRCDYLVNALQSLVEALLFFHPAVWRVSSGIRTEREYCCDDVALSVSGNGMAYAQALAQLETWRGGSTQLGVSTLGGSLMQRIQRMVGTNDETGRGPRGVLHATLALIAAGSIGAAAFGLSAPAECEGQRDGEQGCALCEAREKRVTLRETLPEDVRDKIQALLSRGDHVIQRNVIRDTLPENVRDKVQALISRGDHVIQRNVIRETLPEDVRDNLLSRSNNVIQRNVTQDLHGRLVERHAPDLEQLDTLPERLHTRLLEIPREGHERYVLRLPERLHEMLLDKSTLHDLESLPERLHDMLLERRLREHDEKLHEHEALLREHNDKLREHHEALLRRHHDLLRERNDERLLDPDVESDGHGILELPAKLRTLLHGDGEDHTYNLLELGEGPIRIRERLHNRRHGSGDDLLADPDAHRIIDVIREHKGHVRIGSELIELLLETDEEPGESRGGLHEHLIEKLHEHLRHGEQDDADHDHDADHEHSHESHEKVSDSKGRVV